MSQGDRSNPQIMTPYTNSLLKKFSVAIAGIVGKRQNGQAFEIFQR
jgi:hypothetical protein